MSIKVGQVGVGHLGERHCDILTSIADAQLIGVYDIDAERSQSIANKIKVQSFTSFQDLLSEVEAVIVAVPTRNHFEIVKEALDNKRHVFVEKPITSAVPEAEEIVQMARQNDLVLQVGHIERYNPAFTNLTSRKLEPMFIEAHRLASFDIRGTDVAVVLDLMIHDLDLILNLVASPIQRIDASGLAVVSPEIDIANARVQFQNGCVANITASRISQKKMRKMRLFQRDAYISMDFLTRCSEIYKLEPEPDVRAPKAFLLGSMEKNGVKKYFSYEKVNGENEDALKSELASFIKCVITGEKPLVDGEAAKKVLQVATEITSIIEEQNMRSQ